MEEEQEKGKGDTEKNKTKGPYKVKILLTTKHLSTFKPY